MSSYTVTSLNLSSNSVSIGPSDVQADLNGNVHIAFRQGNSTLHERCWWKLFHPGYDYCVNNGHGSNDTGRHWCRQLPGQVHAVISRAEYDEQWQLVASAILYTMNNGSGFSTLLDVSGRLSQVSNARLSLDPDGHAHVIFTQSQNDMGFNPKLYYTHNRSGAFI